MMKASSVPIGTAITVMPGRDLERGLERPPEVRVLEDELVGVERRLGGGREERVAEEALVEDQEERGEHQHRRHQDRGQAQGRPPRHPRAAPPRPGSPPPRRQPPFIAACHFRMKASRFIWFRFCSSESSIGTAFSLSSPTSSFTRLSVASPVTSLRSE